MIHYTDTLDMIRPEHLHGFFVGWPDPPSVETHLRLLHGSAHVVLAIEDETGEVVGFITAITDGILFAYLPLLEVLPKYQHRGIGGELVRRMLERLKYLYAIDLLCDTDVQPFYERFGMRRVHGMAVRNYSRQGG